MTTMETTRRVRSWLAWNRAGQALYDAAVLAFVERMEREHSSFAALTSHMGIEI